MVQFGYLTAERATVTASVVRRPTASHILVSRLSPDEAYAASSLGGTPIVDIRPASIRAREGTIPGALVIELNAPAWRLEPTAFTRLANAARLDLPVILICSDGRASNLAAAAARELGLRRATDVVGGFAAWRGDGYPVARGYDRRGQDLLDDQTLAITF
jgi:rhodanese-related sulfurtransferase